MLKRIEVWDFEIHEHTVLEDFDPGLNLIFGESDSGKTSLVRALKLAAYNIFDPKSVRTGAKNCKVRVDTERGYVMVTRGKDNIWEVCKVGETPTTYEKIGKNILQDAAEIIGLHLITLGDLTLPVNVMDQAEGHFMLNELGGNDASGSMRAQIVDEISGLSGIEGLIKEVSLDRHRFSRAVKDSEDRALEIRGRMHDKQALESEEHLLGEVSALVSIHDGNVKSIESLAEIFEVHAEASEEVDRLQTELISLPNTKIAQATLLRAERAIARAAAMTSLHADYMKAQEEHADGVRRLAELPDIDAAIEAVEKCEDVMVRSTRVRQTAEALADQLEDLDTLEGSLATCDKELLAAEKELQAAMVDIDVCPITQMAVSKECFSNMRFPVLEG